MIYIATFIMDLISTKVYYFYNIDNNTIYRSVHNIESNSLKKIEAIPKEKYYFNNTIPGEKIHVAQGYNKELVDISNISHRYVEFYRDIYEIIDDILLSYKILDNI